ncbi:hypothetical protein [Archaeoglobus sp.]
MNICTEDYHKPKNPILPPPDTFCIEIEPDGYLYSSCGVRIGSWKEHRIRELCFYFFSKGWKILYEGYKQGKEVKELPPFRVKRRKDLIPKISENTSVLFGTEKIVLINRNEGKYMICPLEGYFILNRPLSQVFQLGGSITETKRTHHTGICGTD